MYSSDGFAGKIIALAGRRPDSEQIVLLAGLSLAWLTPQNPDAACLLRYYRERGHPLEALREAALQLFLLAGFQTSLEAAFQIHEVYGHGLPALEEDCARLDSKDFLDRGYKLQARVYAESVGKLRENLARISPELEKWTALVGYGLVMSRPGIPPHWRELLEIAVLAVQGFPRQLHSHYLGALNLGASAEEIETILEVSSYLASPDAAKSARHLWRRIGR